MLFGSDGMAAGTTSTGRFPCGAMVAVFPKSTGHCGPRHTPFLLPGLPKFGLPTKLCSMVLFNGHFPPMPLSYSNPLHPTGWPVAKLRPTPRHVAPQRSKHCAMLRLSVVALFVSASKAPAAQHTVAAIKGAVFPNAFALYYWRFRTNQIQLKPVNCT